MIHKLAKGLCLVGMVSLGAIAMLPLSAQAQSRTTFLSGGESETYEGYFLADESIYADCDADCVDIDIYLYDAYTGALVASDVAMDASPVVFAPYEGDFLVETSMVTCYHAICEVWTDSDYGF